VILDGRNEVARGYLIICVIYVHILYVVQAVGVPAGSTPFTDAQIKLLAPHVTVFFYLSGLTSRQIGKRNFASVAQNSLTLLMIAWVVHIVGLLAATAIYGGYPTARALFHDLVKPVILGTGDVTYVAWFFTVLAVARLLAWIFEKSKIGFVVAVLAISAAVWTSQRLGLPDNIYEWRNWPVATLFFLLGMKTPKTFRLSAALALAALAGSLALTWINEPGMWHHAPCLRHCRLDFVSQPMVGQYGSLPVFLMQEALFGLFLVAAAGWTVPFITRTARFFGVPSLQILILHGWIIASLFPVLGYVLPHHENIALLVLLFFAGPAIHAAFYLLLRLPLNWTVASISDVSRRVIAGVQSVSKHRVAA
jgi:hypothetical protein